MVFRTSKRTSNHGQMLSISTYKQAIASGKAPPGMSEQKRAQICAQVAKRRADQDMLKKWAPKEARRDRRKKRQVGSI